MEEKGLCCIGTRKGVDNRTEMVSAGNVKKC